MRCLYSAISRILLEIVSQIPYLDHICTCTIWKINSCCHTVNTYLPLILHDLHVSSLNSSASNYSCSSTSAFSNLGVCRIPLCSLWRRNQPSTRRLKSAAQRSPTSLASCVGCANQMTLLPHFTLQSWRKGSQGINFRSLRGSS